MADRIRLRTRLGKGLSKSGQIGGSPKPLEKLSSAYIARRRSLDLSGETNANKSNLTQRGDLLKSITHEATEGNIRIFLDGQHYSGLSNERLAEILSEDDAKRAAKKAAGELPSATKKQRKKKSKILKALRKLSKLLRLSKTKALPDGDRKPKKSGQPSGNGRPARPFMGVTDPEIKFFARIYAELIREILEKALKNFK